jgi:hypothetical protein
MNLMKDSEFTYSTFKTKYSALSNKKKKEGEGPAQVLEVQ